MQDWNAVLAALETDPHDADALLAALRTPPLGREFAHVWPDTLDDASALVKSARAALAAEFAQPHQLGDGDRSAMAFMLDAYEWVIGGALRVNPDWPRRGPWHQNSGPVALLHRPGREVVCGPAVTRLGLDILGRSYLYTQLHDPYAVRMAYSLADWAAHKRR